MLNKTFGIRWLRDQDGGGGTPPAEPAQEQPEGKADPAPSAGKGELRSYSQEELDKMFAGRAKQAASAAERSILEKLGVKSVDDLAVIVKSKQDADAQNLSDLEKLQKELDEVKAARESADAELQSMKLQRSFEATARTLKIQFASEKAADTAYGMVDPKAAADDKGMEAEIKRIAAEHSYLVKQAEAEEIDATSKGRNKGGPLTEERKVDLKSRFRLS